MEPIHTYVLNIFYGAPLAVAAALPPPALPPVLQDPAAIPPESSTNEGPILLPRNRNLRDNQRFNCQSSEHLPSSSQGSPPPPYGSSENLD